MRFDTISLTVIDPHPANPRGPVDQDCEEFAQLVRSISRIGILTPPAVRPSPLIPGRYQIEAGHRRVAAARAAGMTEVGVYIADHDDDTAFIAVVAENEVRQDLTAEQRNTGLQGVLMLADAGLVSDALGIPESVVHAARKGCDAIAADKRRQLTIDELAALGKYADTPHAATLEAHIGKPSFAYTLALIERGVDPNATADDADAAMEAARDVRREWLDHWIHRFDRDPLARYAHDALASSVVKFDAAHGWSGKDARAYLGVLVAAGYEPTPWERQNIGCDRTCASCAATEDECSGAGSDDPACGDWRAR